MNFLLAFLPGKAKLYGLIGLAFVVGLLGWRRSGIKSALNKERVKQQQRRAEAIAEKRRLDREAEFQDDEYLIERLSKRKNENAKSQNGQT